MSDVTKVNMQQLRQWLAGEVEVRLPRGWLVLGAVVVAVLVGVALD